MDWKDDEVNRRLNNGSRQFCSATNMMEEAEAIQRDIEREEKSRMIEEENNVILKHQLAEAREANKKLEEQNKELKEANKKLEIQIEDYKKESKSNKIRSNISITIALLSLIVSIVAIVLSAVLR